jgi:hypothetical protein
MASERDVADMMVGQGPLCYTQNYNQASDENLQLNPPQFLPVSKISQAEVSEIEPISTDAGGPPETDLLPA